MHLILCRLIWSDGTSCKVPPAQTLCEYHQPRLGSRYLLYCYTMGSDLSQPTSTSYTLYRIFLKYTLHRIIPVASFLCIRFLCVMCSFSTANSLSTSTSSPIGLMASTLWCVDQRVTCAPLGCFFHSGICKLARQPYVLDCFACSSNACRNLSEPPTLQLIIPL